MIVGANLQYQVPLKIIGNIFDKVERDSGPNIRFIRETSESKYTLTVNLYHKLDGLLTQADFESIEYYREKIERADRNDDEEMVKEMKQVLSEDYTAEQIADYDEFGGDYDEYITTAAEKVLAEFEDFVDDWEDEQVFIETWL